jgi:hypothetical protein
MMSSKHRSKSSNHLNLRRIDHTALAWHFPQRNCCRRSKKIGTFLLRKHAEPAPDPGGGGEPAFRRSCYKLPGDDKFTCTMNTDTHRNRTRDGERGAQSYREMPAWISKRGELQRRGGVGSAGGVRPLLILGMAALERAPQREASAGLI